jgi:hypothetical protein
MNAPSYSLTNDTITIVWKGKPITVQKSAANFKGLRAAIVSENWADIENHLTAAKTLKDWAKGRFTFNETTGEVLCDDKPLPRELNQRLINVASSGADPTPILLFWERLQKNPSWRSVQQLWSFLAHAHIPLTTDGCFLAYKGVQNDYKDAHSGKYDNTPGNIHEMPRNQISDDPNEACHVGFHVGAYGYAGTFSHRVVICKVDPEHVVCVPYDHNAQKMRVCRYEVIGNYGCKLPSTLFVDDTVKEDPPYLEPDEQDDAEAEASLDDLDEDDEDEDDDFPDDIETGPSDLDEDTEEEAVAVLKSTGTVRMKAGPGVDLRDVVGPLDEPEKVEKTAPDFGELSMKDLMEQSISDLRQYAGKVLNITGASKIPGGKTSLVATIIKVRKKK